VRGVNTTIQQQSIQGKLVKGKIQTRFDEKMKQTGGPVRERKTSQGRNLGDPKTETTGIVSKV